MTNDVSKSWFAVLNNPQDHGYAGTPEEICCNLRDDWIRDSTTRKGIWAYCVSADGLPHVHMVLEDKVAMRFSAIKNSYAIGAHLEHTKGSKQQAEDYIYKRHPFEEKGETVVCVVKAGEIRGNSGHRSDLDRIQELLDDGKKPNEIMAENFAFTRYSKQIKEDYFRRLWNKTPPIRDVDCHYIVGDSGSGKTYTYVELCAEYGENEVCLVSDYTVGGMDHYAGEKILFLDEYKGQLPYAVFLTITDRYKAQVHARYANIWALWSHVYVTSVYSPEAVFRKMVPYKYRGIDSMSQMMRRIADITYCHKEDGVFKRFTIPTGEYTNYADLKAKALNNPS